MSKEKVINLTRYVNDLKSKLSATVVPDKHQARPAQYKQFLERELASTNAKIESLKMSAPVDGKK